MKIRATKIHKSIGTLENKTNKQTKHVMKQAFEIAKIMYGLINFIGFHDFYAHAKKIVKLIWASSAALRTPSTLW